MPEISSSGVSASSRAFSALLVFLVVSATYLYTFPQPNIFYAVIVLLHATTGVVAAVMLAIFFFRLLRNGSFAARVGWVLLAAGAVIGIVLIKTGTPRVEWNWLYVHILLSLAGVGILFADWAGNRGWLGIGAARAVLRLAICLLALAGLGYGTRYVRESRWQKHARIENPAMPPANMSGEGDGPEGAFFPSSAQVYGKRKIPSKFFMESDSCKRCHQDIYNQWFSSAHHFSSFNNQWYRKSVEYMQDTIGPKPSKWCGGCHDPAVLYSGLMDTPIKQIVHRPESQAGLGCMMCHSIANVKSTMGQGDFYLEYPRLHELAATKNPIARGLHDFLIRLNPEPHRRVFLKPFMREQTAEFCSSCHKVHLDVPVNNYRWFRGFNEYDNWQASGVSGQGARSFYYPPKPQQCADCHMPTVPSNDFGNINGLVHSHRFAAANTAVPTSYGDETQVREVEKFLKGALSVDIFALAEEPQGEGGQVAGPGGEAPQLASTFAVGEESARGLAGAANVVLQPAKLVAPLGRVPAEFRRSDTVRVEVVVRTRKLGHFFPGGTVDAFDVWLELQGRDSKGRIVYWSGKTDDDGKGPVDPGAHFYRSLQLDAHGNVINKRNAWSTRAVMYAHLIPPGAADTVHFRLKVPEDCGDAITLTAKLNYRKFMWWNTQFAFAGVRDPSDPDPDVTKNYDDGRWIFKRDLAQVSAKSKEIPDVPTVVIAQNEVTLPVAGRNAPPFAELLKLDPKDRERWNDFGIGLLLQGDLKGAERAFEKVTEIDTKYADGWVNVDS